jgi:hypothetical protein
VGAEYFHWIGNHARAHRDRDGYARWELARLKRRLALPCVEYELTEEEAIRWLLQKHHRSNGMNDFCRILLAIEIEPCLKAKALSNQQFGGRTKGSSNLTEDATVDVREETAAAAGSLSRQSDQGQATDRYWASGTVGGLTRQ